MIPAVAIIPQSWHHVVDIGTQRGLYHEEGLVARISLPYQPWFADAHERRRRYPWRRGDERASHSGESGQQQHLPPSHSLFLGGCSILRKVSGRVFGDR